MTVSVVLLRGCVLMGRYGVCVGLGTAFLEVFVDTKSIKWNLKAYGGVDDVVSIE